MADETILQYPTFKLSATPLPHEINSNTLAAELRTRSRRSVDVDVDLGGGRRLTGTVPGVYGTRLVSLGYSRLKAKQRLRTWVELLALAASEPDQSWTGHAPLLPHRPARWLRIADGGPWTLRQRRHDAGRPRIRDVATGVRACDGRRGAGCRGDPAVRVLR